ncbi:UNVERIFIED_CONTAM: DNA topoisomerase 3-alpha [Sesamum indicum]
MAGGGGRPLRALNVAEKPSVAKAVSGILARNPSSGGLRVREGRSRYNKIFEFNYAIQNQQFHMAFTSVTGHLMEVEFEDRYRKWHSCDPVDLYHAPVKKHVPHDKSDIEKTLEEEARKSQWLILWLDCDREGENIAFEVVEVCTRANRNLNIWRARFSALIDREIHYAAQHLIRPNQLFADAVDVRQEIDLRIGASFTRFQTMLLRDAFVLDFTTDDKNVILSYGPCQFPTLGFVVERFWEIQSHEPEEFWTINCTHNSEEGTATFNWMRGHLFDYTCATILYEMCVQEPTATVTNVRQQEKPKYPPHPLSTIELEKRASRYFRMSSEQTMKVAEDLYQAGFISYPRTETDCFSERTDLHEEGKGIHNHQAVPKVIPEVRVLGIQRILLAHILLRVHEVVVHRLRMLLEKMRVCPFSSCSSFHTCFSQLPAKLNVPENPQFHVHPVGHHAICAQLILQPIEEESSIHVKLKAATSLLLHFYQIATICRILHLPVEAHQERSNWYLPSSLEIFNIYLDAVGKIMPTAEEQSHEEVPADQHLLPAGEVVVAGHSFLLLVSPYPGGALFVAIHHTLQTLVLIGGGNASNSGLGPV